jgi:hypothetical protein
MPKNLAWTQQQRLKETITSQVVTYALAKRAEKRLLFLLHIACLLCGLSKLSLKLIVVSDVPESRLFQYCPHRCLPDLGIALGGTICRPPPPPPPPHTSLGKGTIHFI